MLTYICSFFKPTVYSLSRYYFWTYSLVSSAMYVWTLGWMQKKKITIFFWSTALQKIASFLLFSTIRYASGQTTVKRRYLESPEYSQTKCRNRLLLLLNRTHVWCVHFFCCCLCLALRQRVFRPNIASFVVCTLVDSAYRNWFH